MTLTGTASGRIVIHLEDPKVIGRPPSNSEGYAERASHSGVAVVAAVEAGHVRMSDHAYVATRPPSGPPFDAAIGFHRYATGPSLVAAHRRRTGGARVRWIPRDRGRPLLERRCVVAVSCHVATAPLPLRPTVRTSMGGRTFGAGPMPERIDRLSTSRAWPIKWITMWPQSEPRWRGHVGQFATAKWISRRRPLKVRSHGAPQPRRRTTRTRPTTRG